MPDETIKQGLAKQGVSRRDFLKLSGLLAAAMGLHAAPVEASGLPVSLNAPASGYQEQAILHAIETKQRLPVIWLEFQDCTGCTEAVSRSVSPSLGNLVLNTLTIEYHETLSAAAGFQVEQAKKDAMEKYAGQYVLVVEGSIPTDNDGAYCVIGGRSAVDILKEAAAGAAAIIAVGNCAAYGGLPKAKPNPTGAKGVWELITDKAVVNISGCPAIPEATTGVIAHFAVFGTLPKLDKLNRPLTFYGKTVHDRCLRRPFYEAGKFALSFDDEGAREGYCLYKLGCKGPTTYNACATIKWDQGLSFPIQSGHPCLGCSEPNFWDGGGFYEGQSAPLDRPTITAVGAAIGAGAALGIGTALVNQSKKKAKKGES
ncbi:MAG: hydrogenase small subunit [Anaerolineales bacterium]|nr:hydrogenase small subunit [Anaerolineales bacterium]